MGGEQRTIFIISDLHLGGAPPNDATKQQGDDGEHERRGFRMMTQPRALVGFIDKLRDTKNAELVINGDFVDFLAEAHGAEREFRPFLYDEQEAVDVFRRIAGRQEGGRSNCEPGREEWDPLVFDALGRFLASGKRLTIMLGNHDLELCLPAVREELVRRLGGGELHFRYDGEALPIGSDVLVEHGNLYDRANVVDHHGLRKLRANLTRGLKADLEQTFSPPVGSRIVSEIMNPIKGRYGFIDLLKPESEALFALLIAIEPDSRARIADLLKALGGIPVDSIAAMRGDQRDRGRGRGSATRDGRTASSADPVQAVMAQLFGVEQADEFLRGTLSQAEPDGRAIRSAGWLTSKLGLSQLLIGAGFMGTSSRVDAVRRAMRALAADKCFSIDAEAKTYAARAAEVARGGGFSCVVFGHTHLAKDATLGDVHYLNSGTWANLMRFPDLPNDESGAKAALTKFMEDVRDNKLESYVRFAPTYVRLDLCGERLQRARLYQYDRERSIEAQLPLERTEGGEAK